MRTVITIIATLVGAKVAREIKDFWSIDRRSLAHWRYRKSRSRFVQRTVRHLRKESKRANMEGNSLSASSG